MLSTRTRANFVGNGQIYECCHFTTNTSYDWNSVPVISHLKTYHIFGAFCALISGYKGALGGDNFYSIS